MIIALGGRFKQMAKVQVTSTGFEPMSAAMPVQCSYQLSNEVTQLRAGQFVELMGPVKGMNVT